MNMGRAMNVKISDLVKPESNLILHKSNATLAEGYMRVNKNGKSRIYIVNSFLRYDDSGSLHLEREVIFQNDISIMKCFSLHNPNHRKRWDLIKAKLLQQQKKHYRMPTR